MSPSSYIRRFAGLQLVVLLAWASVSAQQGSGRIEGRVTGPDDSGLGGVTVVVQETGQARISDRDGAFDFGTLPAGLYTLTFRLSKRTLIEQDVELLEGQTLFLEQEVGLDREFVETITVTAVSRRVERIVDAPAAVDVVDEEEIRQQASHGQLPKLVEFTPGVEVTQSGIYDYNLNTRGFNSSLNRRVAVLVDGRDPSIPFLGAQEWASVSLPLDDLAGVEFVRGPSAALYGANASSGVLSISSLAPRDSPGGIVRLTAGGLKTTNADVRWAGALAESWYMKVVAGVRKHGDFAVSRMGAAEYSLPCPVPQGGATDCLPQERVPLARENDNRIYSGSLRIDRQFSDSSLFTIEGGSADLSGPLLQTAIGRVQLVDVQRPWARLNYTRNHWSFAVHYNKRDASEQLALGSGLNLVLNSDNLKAEIQTNWEFAEESVRLVLGGSYARDAIDSFDPATDRQTLMFAPVDAYFAAVFGQVDWQATRKLKVVAAARYDDSDLYDPQILPKLALVLSLGSDDTLRLTYNRAFQAPNYSEYFLQVDGAPPLDLSTVETLACDPFGVDCGFETPTRLLAVGNEDLDVEQIETYEIGYSGGIGKRTNLTVDYYYSRSRQFVTDLLPQLGTSLGRINTNFGPYVPPADHPDPGLLLATLDAAVPPQLRPFLSNNFDDTPAFAVRSYTNFGEVETQGVDLSLRHRFGTQWTLSVNYSWFDFKIHDADPSLENLLLPNAPENSVRAGVGYVGHKLDWRLSGRWVDEFRWVVGPFQGDVEAYTTVDLYGNYRINEHWLVGLNIANLMDNEHWESFGGDLLGRRALAHVTYSW